jgi:hypothetical protein
MICYNTSSTPIETNEAYCFEIFIGHVTTVYVTLLVFPHRMRCISCFHRQEKANKNLLKIKYSHSDKRYLHYIAISFTCNKLHDIVTVDRNINMLLQFTAKYSKTNFGSSSMYMINLVSVTKFLGFLRTQQIINRRQIINANHVRTSKILKNKLNIMSLPDKLGATVCL